MSVLFRNSRKDSRMAWLEAHDELLNHPKTAVLSASMSWNKYESVGRLMAFWWWALKYAPTGDLRKFNDDVLGTAVELNGDAATKFVKTMTKAGWIDRSDNVFRIHDWPEYVKRFLRDARFKGRPDKWSEVEQIYPDMPGLSSGDALHSNSGVTPRVTRATIPTNQPTNKGRRSAADKTTEAVLDALNGSGKSGRNA